MKRLLLATTAVFALGTAAQAGEVIPMGISIGYTGPLESMAPGMTAAAELAFKEVSDSGLLLDGSTITTHKADTTCIDAAAATAAMERIVTSDKVRGIVGGMCSGETTATLQNVAMPNGVVMIAPSATSPALSTIEANDLFYRTSPSDARQGVVMAEVLQERGFKTVAVTYTNNDYGKGLADAFQAAFEAIGGKVTINAPHEDGKADYTAEVGALAAAGGEILVLAGYVDQGGSGIIRGSLDSGAFEKFLFPDGMVGTPLETNFGTQIDGSFGTNPASEGEGRDKFMELAKAAGFDGNSAFAAESYDAAALMMLAMAKAKSSDPAVYKKEILNIANGEGEKIYPGELAKALEILNGGGTVDYEGATSVTFVNGRESAGSYRETEIKDGKITVVKYR